MSQAPAPDDSEPVQDIVTAAVLVVGDEILSGRTKEKNSGTIADHLTGIGIRLREIRVVPDIEDEITNAVNALRTRYDYVFTTGGIGPTHDDITADAVARAFGVPLNVDERAVAILQRHYSVTQTELTPARLRMARIPEGGDLIENSVSGAPGFIIGNVIVMAGVPRIMEAMLAAVSPRLRTGRKLISLTIHTRTPEGRIAEPLAAAQLEFPDISMGSYPYFENGRPGVNLVLRGTDKIRLLSAADALKLKLQAAGIGYETAPADENGD